MTTFSYTSGDPNNLTAAAPASMADIQGPFVDLRTFINSRSINEDNLPVSTLQRLGLNDSSGQKGRGKSIIATSGTRTNVAFGQLSDGPDQVAGIVLPTDGLITVFFQAVWSCSVANAAQASIFVGATQAKIATGASVPVVQTVTSDGGAGIVTPLSTGPGGLMASAGAGAVSAGSDVTTGQIIGNASYEAATAGGGTGVTAPRAPIGGPCYLFAAAGTYTVGIQFLAASGTVTVTNRKLWVKAEAYA